MKISIVTVCRNSGKTIEGAIRIVISQHYYDLEHIVIDVGSVDDTCQIIRKYEMDSCIKYIQNLTDKEYP